MANTHITKALPAAIVAEIVELITEAGNWTETIDDGEGNQIPNVSKELFTQKVFNQACRKIIKNARGLKRNKELGAIPDEDIFN